MCALSQLPDFGPLEIKDLNKFLNESKKVVFERFEKNSELKGDAEFFKNLTHVQTIGIGSFGTVMLMSQRDDFFAVKAIDKKYILKTKQVRHILNEKNILSVMNFPFIVHLVKYYLDNSYIYFVMPFISGGDLFTALKKTGKFDENLSKFYASQVVFALEYLHFLDFIYRDLKPENVLLDHTGYIKITDFGFGKLLKTRTWTLCGTPEYLAPEIILSKGYSKSVDWWALGVFIFEMVSGRSPFYAKQPLKIYEKVLAGRYIFPIDITPEAKSIIKGFLQPNISQRIGSLKNGINDIKEHPWFNSVDWTGVLNRSVTPPYVPKVTSPGCNFGNYKHMTLKISDTNTVIKEFGDVF